MWNITEPQNFNFPKTSKKWSSKLGSQTTCNGLAEKLLRNANSRVPL